MQLKTLLKLSSSNLEKFSSNWILIYTLDFFLKQSQETSLYGKTWAKEHSVHTSSPVLDSYRDLEKIPKKNLEPLT